MNAISRLYGHTTVGQMGEEKQRNNKIMEPGETAQPVKNQSCKHKDLNWSQQHKKKLGMVAIAVIPSTMG